MEVQTHHEKLFVVLAVLVGVTTVTNLMLTKRADRLEQMLTSVEARLYSPTITVAEQPRPSVSILSFAPTDGRIGTIVRIDGKGFDEVGNKIHFGSSVLIADKDTNAELYFSVPGILSVCPMSAGNPIPSDECGSSRTQPRTYSVRVESSNGLSDPVEFTVKP